MSSESMESLSTSLPTVDLKSPLRCGRLSVKPWAQLPAYPLDTTVRQMVQTERANQDLKFTLRCVTERYPAFWSSHLPWIKYAHNSPISSAIGRSPFMASLRLHPSLFPAQEEEFSVPSVR